MGVHVANLHGVAVLAQYLRDGVDDSSLSWMGGGDSCPGSVRSAESSVLGRLEGSSGVAGCILEQSLQRCWRVGVVFTKVHSVT